MEDVHHILILYNGDQVSITACNEDIELLISARNDLDQRIEEMREAEIKAEVQVPVSIERRK